MSQSDGEFEVHLTVEPSSDISALRAWAELEDVKFTHIVLSQGETASQPMLTFHGRGDLESQLGRAKEIGSQIEQLGCPVTRVKVEVGLNDARVPESDFVASSLPPENYFEFHIKMKLAADADLTSLAQLAIRNSAHLSRNAFRSRNDGFQERFVTQRARNLGKPNAIKQYEILLSEIEQHRVAVIEVEQEFVVFDSNLEVDAGWMKGKVD